MREVYVEVPGVAVPQGSMRSFNGKVCHAKPALKAWRKVLKDRFTEAISGVWTGPLIGAVYAYVVFVLPRPKSCKRDRPHVRPDADKLLRATFDAATDAGVWMDDGQVTEVHAFKQYVREGEEPGVKIYIKELV